ncbi:hypothetical protein FW800_04925 [Pseudomonas sp. 910_23]
MVGLVIRDRETGLVKVDMTMSISQTQGSVVTNSANGSIAIPAPPPGKVQFPIVVPLQDRQLEKGKVPSVTISNGVLSWIYSYNTNGWGNFSANCIIYYGYY